MTISALLVSDTITCTEESRSICALLLPIQLIIHERNHFSKKNLTKNESFYVEKDLNFLHSAVISIFSVFDEDKRQLQSLSKRRR